MNSDLINQIKNNEGYEPSAYEDSLGFLSIGWGFCIDKKKGGQLFIEESEFILQNRINKAEKLLSTFKWFQIQDDVRKGVLIELAYNMGLHGLLEFTKMLSGFSSKNYNIAANEFINSLAAKQIKKTRTDNIVHRIKIGTY